MGFGGVLGDNLGRRINLGKGAGIDLAGEICQERNVTLTLDIVSLVILYFSR